MSEHVQDVLDVKAIEKQMLDTHKTLESFIEKSNKEIEATGAASAETKAAVDKLSEKAIEIGDRLAELEQKQARRFEDAPETKTPGELLVASDEFKSMMQHRRGGARVEYKTAIVNATPAMNAPLVAGHRLDGVVREPNRALRIRDVMQVGRTSSNLVYFAKEDTFTNAAAVVRNTSASPIVAAENVTKPESALTFTSDQEAVVTIAHFIPVSKQALDDSVFLASYVNSRLMYGLKLTEDDQLLNGTGVTGYITGLNTGATAFVNSASPNYTSRLDIIRDAKRQAQVSNYEPDVVILNPTDWAAIELEKSSGDGNYMFANPQGIASPMLWGMTVVVTNTQSAGTFTVHASPTAQIWDREDASVEISYEDSTNFQKNMATVRAEERLALTVYNVLGTIKGTF